MTVPWEKILHLKYTILFYEKVYAIKPEPFYVFFHTIYQLYYAINIQLNLTQLE